MAVKNLLKRERVAYIQRQLEALYPETPVPLKHKDPYTLLVAVLLSAQCTDERVNQVTPALWQLADNPRDMALVPVEKSRRLSVPAGCHRRNPRRSANCHRFWSMNTTVPYRKIWPHWKPCPASATKPPAS